MELGDFEIEGPFGDGGLGEVLAATEKQTGRLVVIKRPKSTEQQGHQRARDEGRLGLRLNGTSFVETLGLFDVGGVPHIALERIEGVTVLELWRRTGALSYPAVARIGAEVCQGLAVMHVLRDDEGTPLRALHRDISSRNVMVGSDGRVRIIDLGAAFTESADRSAVSRAGVVIGTLSYLPPEVFEGGVDSPARDMWSVGVMLLEAAIGNVFSRKRQGEGTIEGLQRVRRKSLDPFADPAVSAIEPRLLAILKQLLTKDPALRMDAKTASAEFSALCAGLKPEAELARRVERSRQLPKPVPSPKAEVASPPSVVQGPSRTHADEKGLQEDGPTIQDPPRRFESAPTLEDGPTVQDRAGWSPAGGQPVGVDGPSGVARPWPKSPPPPPATENTFMRLRTMTEPESGGGVFEGDVQADAVTGPTLIGVETVPVAKRESAPRSERAVDAKVVETVLVDRPRIKPAHVRLFPWKGALAVVGTLGGALWLLVNMR